MSVTVEPQITIETQVIRVSKGLVPKIQELDRQYKESLRRRISAQFGEKVSLEDVAAQVADDVAKGVSVEVAA